MAKLRMTASEYNNVYGGMYFCTLLLQLVHNTAWCTLWLWGHLYNAYCLYISLWFRVTVILYV